ncbi:alpha/beta hydrolase family protein [Agromyces indicus]|uniref:Alpha/beta fold hydrolase n=1 Tax=Agromyces indicus TaxID=758919 RepID=A0ABU1FFK9_9MICO|nr:alpha/beta fold hydrolase [Agromyces indicus]MDR5690534.1 alpha/beta fold hydrolase [Agromyces indicus]
MSRLAAIGAIAAGGAAVSAIAGIAVARYAVLGRRRPMRAVFRADTGTVALPRMDATVQPRTFGLQLGRRLFRVQEIVRVDASTVERRVEHCDLHGPAEVYFVGDVFGRESPIARSAIAHTGEMEGISFVHWDVVPDDASERDVWLVHVHGMGAAPSSTLRSVESVREAGYPSTIVSLEASADIDNRGRGMAPEHLHRVLAAIDHAIQQGATRVVMVGWSYGARLVLDAADRRPDVAGVVLISPMFDLLHVLRLVATRQRLPKPLIAAAAAVLSTPVVCRLAGIDRPIGDGLDLASAPRTLIFHSRGDTTVPIEITRSAVAAFGDVDLVEFLPTPHTLEWNRDPELFGREIREWLCRLDDGGVEYGAR